jgi:hypothetical protein
LVSLTLTVAVERACSILLNRGIRQVIKRIVCRTTLVMHFNNARSGGIETGSTQQSLKNTKQTNIQHL